MTRLIQAYRSLLDYIIWCDKKFTHTNTGKVIHILTPDVFIIHLLIFLTQALVCYCVATYRSDLVVQVVVYLKEIYLCMQSVALISLFCLSQVKWKPNLLVSDYPDSGDNKDMENYFRQASVNLKDILENPGVWDPFILSYVEVGTSF